MTMVRYFQLFIIIHLISVIVLACYQGYVSPTPSGLIPSVLFYIVAPLISVVIFVVLIYMPFYLSGFVFEKINLFGKLIMFAWVIFVCYFFFSKEVEESVKNIKLDVVYMSNNLQEGDYLFINKVLPHNKVSSGSYPLVRNIKTGKDGALSCGTSTTYCNYIGDKRFVNKIHHVKYYQMTGPDSYITLLFEIDGYEGFSVEDFVHRYQGHQKIFFSDLIWYSFSCGLLMVFLVGLKIKE